MAAGTTGKAVIWLLANLMPNPEYRLAQTAARHQPELVKAKPVSPKSSTHRIVKTSPLAMRKCWRMLDLRISANNCSNQAICCLVIHHSEIQGSTSWVIYRCAYSQLMRLRGVEIVHGVFQIRVASCKHAGQLGAPCQFITQLVDPCNSEIGCIYRYRS